MLHAQNYLSAGGLGASLKDEEEQKKCVDDRIKWGKTDDSWACTTLGKIDARSAAICFCFNPMIFPAAWFCQIAKAGQPKVTWILSDFIFSFGK